ncbi:PAS/PAC domain [Geminocystis sp. NIES-3708]|uniref:sensor domain-containing diguanylate cyclase n=1 Tax=Geminocystis sp. NIES-3708 TaxID=1615909 RepID=UPI0005FC8FEC|nr:diguanylate cyclase [Geminocystis sp. NIES-3708]BAQ60096.1 PAS/PAC domain [Geminocystis sp. NIES-3708]
MNITESFFLSVNYAIFCPKVLTYIKNYLKCEQVFISQLNSAGEQDKIIDNEGNICQVSPHNFADNYQLEQKIISYVCQESVNYYTHQSSLDFDVETEPLKRAELAIPIIIKTSEIVEISNIKFWGILFIYDYNYLREWQSEEIKVIEDIINQLVVAIERYIVYDQYKIFREELRNCQVLDDVTGLAKYSSFLDCLDYEWRRLAREKQPLSLILIAINFDEDLTNHKIIELANILQEEIKRPTDLAAHYQENYLIIMLPNTDNNGALWVNQKIFTRVSKEIKNRYDCEYKYSIITKIPQVNDDYSDLLTTMEKMLISDEK